MFPLINSLVQLTKERESQGEKTREKEGEKIQKKRE